MQDRPTYDELLEAVSVYLREHVMPATEGQVSFHARVAANALDWVRRELDLQETQIAREWEGLDHLLGVEGMPPRIDQTREAIRRRNVELSERIREGHADEGPWRDEVLAHLRRSVYEKLVVSLDRLAAEGRPLMQERGLL